MAHPLPVYVCSGLWVVTLGTKVGRTKIEADSDGEVKLCWADGNGTSGYVKVEALTRVTKSEWDAAQKAVRFRQHATHAHAQASTALQYSVDDPVQYTRAHTQDGRYGCNRLGLTAVLV